MRLNDLKLSTKIMGGFLLIVVILAGAILYQLASLSTLAGLQDEGASRADDAVEISQIMERLSAAYVVIGDAVINRNLEASHRDFAELKAQAAKDMARVRELVDTEEERMWAAKADENYTAFLTLFGQETLPLLDSILAAGSETVEQTAKISALDGSIDEKRNAAGEYLEKVTASLAREMTDADERFDAVRKRTILVATMLSLAGAALAILIGFLLTRAITRPLTSAIKDLRYGSDQVTSAAGQLTATSQQLAEGASEQAASLEETSSSLEEMASMTRHNADNANQAKSLVLTTNDIVAKANQSMSELTVAMADISTASEDTSKIIKTIDEIAFQTNLLALNAAVEAARAGEAGAGFAVVADEVRNLAMRAAQAAKDTAVLIEETVKKVQNGNTMLADTNENFSQVADSSEKVAQLVSEITASSDEQAKGISQINLATTEMDKVIQQTAAGAEESASGAEELNAQAEAMNRTVKELTALLVGKMGKTNNNLHQGAAYAPPKKEGRKIKALPGFPQKRPQIKTAIDPESVIPMDDDDFKDF